MSYIKRVFIASITATLFACSSTPYQPQSFRGGFSEAQLDKNVFRVTFQGNAYTSIEDAQEMTLLRCAELTLKNEFTHFAIADGYGRTDPDMGMVKSRTASTIVMYAGKPALNGLVYDAAFIIDSIGPKYGVRK